jgi:tRNA nucleotidyltransferase (CCA-adding enzyme)
MMPVFQQAIPVLRKMEEAGFEAYFVGGCVRDFILGREIADVDIATSATPEEIKMIFPKTVDVGIEHGTVIVIWNKQTYELTTFRTDGEYTDYRRPAQVTFIRSLFEDLKRRDFTMNSLAMDKEGRVIDPFSGIQAIENKQIETVGSASERFHEDALRMMRAVRFVSQLSFSIVPHTFQALKANAALLKNISVERISVEFEKLLNGPNRKKALQILVDSGLFLHLPGLKEYREALHRSIQFQIEHLSVVEMWVLLLYLIEIPLREVDSFLRNWKLPVVKIKSVKSMLQQLHSRLQSEWSIETIYYAEMDHVISTEKIYNILKHQPVLTSIRDLEKRYGELVIKDRSELAVTGHDLMKWENRNGGPWVKEKLRMVEKAVLYKQVPNSREKIREWLLTCNQK